MPQMVSTGVLAQDLGITDRRVQQLVAEFVLPPPREGRHDRDLCAERYRLFRHHDDATWARHQREAEDGAAEADRLVAAACAAGSTPEMITDASRAHQAAMATMRFGTVVGFRDNEPARHYALKDIERLDEEIMGNLLHRGMEIMAERSGKSLAEVKAKITVDCEARERGADPDNAGPPPNRAARRAARHAGRAR